MKISTAIHWSLVQCLLLSTGASAFTVGRTSFSLQQKAISSSVSFSTAVVSGETTATANGASVSDDNKAENEEDISTYVRCGKCQTVYPMTEEALGKGRGRRLECAVCEHTWFQSKERLLSVKPGFEMVDLPEDDLNRIHLNIKEGKSPDFMGSSKLYVGNVDFDCHEDDLLAEFSKFGDVGEVSLVRDETGKCRGFGFVTMRTSEDGQKAIDELDGAPVRGRKIAVRESNN